MAKAKKSTKKSKVKKSKAKKAKVKKTKKTARRAVAVSRGKTKKSNAKTPKKAARKAVKAKAKPAKRKAPAVKKAAAAPRKKKQIVGEGDYQASRNFLKDEAEFVRRHAKEIPALGKEAEAALEGPEGGELRAAEEEARSHNKAGDE
jgi:hypothetical protein